MPQAQVGLHGSSLTDRLLTLPPSMFNRHRIRIMVALYYRTGADFTELKKELGLSDGALATHMKALMRDELVKDQGVIDGGRTRTAYLTTEKGHKAVEALLDDFHAIKEAIKPDERH